MNNQIRKCITDNLICATIFFVAAALSIYLSQLPHTITKLWLANIIGIVFLLRYNPRDWLFFLAGMGLAGYLAYFIFGYSSLISGYFTLVNLIEMIFVTSILKYYQIVDRFDKDIKSAFILVITLALIAPFISATLASITSYSNSPFQFWIKWFVGDGICLVTLLPVALCLIRKMWNQMTVGGSLIGLSWFLISISSMILILRYLPYPFINILLPLLLVASFFSVFYTLVLSCVSVFLIFTFYNAGLFVPFVVAQPSYESIFVFIPSVLIFIIPYLMVVLMSLVNRANETMSGLTNDLFYHSTHDSLTGLLNRHEFEIALAKAVEESNLHGTKHILCYLDLDFFKIVNDSVGHAAGDALLQEIAGLLHHRLRKNDVLARLGGDEFGVLLSNQSEETGMALSQQLIKLINSIRFRWNGKLLKIEVSIGMVVISHKTRSAEQLLSDADIACYTAKAEGRNRVFVYQNSQTATIGYQREVLMANTIQEAIEDERLLLYVQKIIPIKSEAIAGLHFEILVRMMTEKKEIIEASAFMSTAECFNLTIKIDRWVLRQLLEKFDKKLSELDVPFFSINLSVNSLNDADFLPFLLGLIKKSSLAPNRLCFEITETAAMNHIAQTINTVTELRQLGCKIALDDFGVGFSSFNYIKNFHVDFIKIDGSFIQNIVNSTLDKTIVQTINDMAHLLDMKTVAEYVESEAILTAISEMGVDYAQGYVIGKPEPLDTIFPRSK